jgi:hypothetical protein
MAAVEALARRKAADAVLKSLCLGILVWLCFRFFDAAQGGLLGVGEALGVDAEEDGDAVASPFGDLGRGHADVEPGG